jgi:hypothetical protein
MSTAFIIGNGPSRLPINLHDLVGKGKIYGCNALYRDFDKFDYLVVIDEQFRKLIELGGKEGVVEGTKLILPPDEECIEETTGRRSNAGMNAMRESIRHGATKLFCLGFDFIIKDEVANTDNVYKDTDGYSEETHATYEDSKHRVNYLHWFMNQNKDVRFTFVVPDPIEIFNIGLNTDNVFGMTINNFNKHYGEQVVVEEAKEAS